MSIDHTIAVPYTPDVKRILRLPNLFAQSQKTSATRMPNHRNPLLTHQLDQSTHDSINITSPQQMPTSIQNVVSVGHTIVPANQHNHVSTSISQSVNHSSLGQTLLTQQSQSGFQIVNSNQYQHNHNHRQQQQLHQQHQQLLQQHHQQQQQQQQQQQSQIQHQQQQIQHQQQQVQQQQQHQIQYLQIYQQPSNNHHNSNALVNQQPYPQSSQNSLQTPFTISQSVQETGQTYSQNIPTYNTTLYYPTNFQPASLNSRDMSSYVNTQQMPPTCQIASVQNLQTLSQPCSVNMNQIRNAFSDASTNGVNQQRNIPPVSLPPAPRYPMILQRIRPEQHALLQPGAVIRDSTRLSRNTSIANQILMGSYSFSPISQSQSIIHNNTQNQSQIPLHETSNVVQPTLPILAKDTNMFDNPANVPMRPQVSLPKVLPSNFRWNQPMGRTVKVPSTHQKSIVRHASTYRSPHTVVGTRTANSINSNSNEQPDNANNLESINLLTENTMIENQTIIREDQNNCSIQNSAQQSGSFVSSTTTANANIPQKCNVEIQTDSLQKGFCNKSIQVRYRDVANKITQTKPSMVNAYSQTDNDGVDKKILVDRASSPFKWFPQNPVLNVVSPEIDMSDYLSDCTDDIVDIE